MRQEYLAAVRQPGQSVNPLFGYLGMEVVAIDVDRAVLRLVVKPEFIQGAGKLAGGMMALLLDEAMAHAVLGGNPGDTVCTTVDMNVSFLRPALEGAELLCEATVSKRGSRVVFAEAAILSGEKEIARATASFLMM